MRTTFAVGRVDRKTNELVVVARVGGNRERIRYLPRAGSVSVPPRGPWTVRAVVRPTKCRGH